MNTKRLTDFIGRNGLKSTAYAAAQHLSDMRVDREYDRMMKERVPDWAELSRQRHKRFAYEPLISVIVPTYRPVEEHFRRMLRSLREQTYANYEILLGNGGGISDNSNAALSQAKGDHIALLDQDDILEPDALYHVVERINEGARLIYTDEDKYDTESGRYLRAFRKKDFDMELLLSNNYVCHFLTIQRELVEKAGGFRSEYDGAQDHDLIIRCAEHIDPGETAHIKRVLYHWRIHELSTAGDPAKKGYAHLAGKRAIEDHLARCHKRGEVIETEHRGFYRVEYEAAEDMSGFELHLARNLKSLSRDNSERMASYLAANDDVGAVSGRVIDRLGRIVYSGYGTDENGRKEALYHGMDHNMPGEFNIASLRQEVPVISPRCMMIRSSLSDCIDPDPFRMSENIRNRGYRIIMDPKMLYLKVR